MPVSVLLRYLSKLRPLGISAFGAISLLTMPGLQEVGDPEPNACYVFEFECASSGAGGFCSLGTISWCDKGWVSASSGVSLSDIGTPKPRKCWSFTSISESDVTRTPCDREPPTGYVRAKGCSNSSDQCCDYQESRSLDASTSGSYTDYAVLSNNCTSTLVPFGD